MIIYWLNKSRINQMPYYGLGFNKVWQGRGQASTPVSSYVPRLPLLGVG